MSQCWSEGELRAYLDGELPARDVERVAAHLKDCQACGPVCAELAGRAARIASLLELLPEPLPPVKMPAIPRSAGRAGRWVAVGAVAAALAAMLVTAPWRPRVGSKPVEVKSAPVPQAMVAPDAPLADTRGSEGSIPGRDRDSALSRKGAVAVRRTTRPRPAPRVEYYVALDDEPIEAGVVVRVGFNGGQVPADVIFGPDGRARAIRLVNDTLGEQ
jgi:Putative zinc-finger